MREKRRGEGDKKDWIFQRYQNNEQNSSTLTLTPFSEPSTGRIRARRRRGLTGILRGDRRRGLLLRRGGGGSRKTGWVGAVTGRG